MPARKKSRQNSGKCYCARVYTHQSESPLCGRRLQGPHLGALSLLAALIFLVWTVTGGDGGSLAGAAILVELLMGGLIMVSMGICGFYLAKMYEGLKRRPRYIVAEQIGGGDTGC